ncbi:FAD-binding oxidoreductase [Jiangella aurantiaca]|uniref:FAD-binding oxidoreductase n=1 Tax=Jiangella aurantiaca TaxID=2530373 RepID=A0A4R5AJ95_9ACTN|nr:FAD-binding oxidoreductase [Jiangella aurantiaca]TDD71054.1 FAD-binding oxidoreductase [Jiangella aurantiaca]
MTTTRLREQLGDRLVLPGDQHYDHARAVWNAMVDRRPRMIVRCAGPDDVVAAVRLARELGLEIGVRCGGHSVLGISVPEDGLMIDLTPMGGVSVDPATRRALVQGGALLGALDVAAQRHGLATTAGNVSHTGVGGLTLGGGMGWLARQYGLTCDNVVSYELVTADGERLRVSRDEHPDLFWGLRGGGGNFGIVTEFEFQLHPVGTRAYVAELTYPLERAAAVLRGWRDLSADAPRQATFAAALGRGLLTVGYVWAGPTEQAADLLPHLRSLGVPVTENVGELSYVELQTREDSPEGHAYRRYWKGHYVRGLPDEAIDAMVEHGDVDMGISLQAYGGAIADVPDDDSAFSQRDAAFEYVAAARWSDAAEDAERMTLARRTAASIEPFASGAYVNALSDEGAAGVRRAYRPAKLDRLTAVKTAYDPENGFHLNHNIAPAARS